MKYFLKNFYRNSVANLTIRSIKHFRPDAEIFVMCLTKPGKTYEGQEELLVPPTHVFYRPTKFFDIGPSVANIYNNVFFSEGYNLIYDIVKNMDDKVLLLAEDHFFTTGATLNELEEASFHVAFAGWNTGANGSILAIVPSKLKHHFPISEAKACVEGVLGDWCRKIPHHHVISTRYELDYHGDGYYANTYDEIVPAIKKLEETTNIGL